MPGAEYAIIAVSTPEGEGGEADLSYVESAAGSIADAMDGPLVVVNKSTVPPLTGDHQIQRFHSCIPLHGMIQTPSELLSQTTNIREITCQSNVGTF